MEVFLAKKFVILHDIFVGKNQEALACIKVLLLLAFSIDGPFQIFDLLFEVFFFVDLDTAAHAAQTFAYTDLPLVVRTSLCIFVLDEVKLIKQILQFNTLIVKFIVISKDTCTDKRTLASNWIWRVQFDHI